MIEKLSPSIGDGGRTISPARFISLMSTSSSSPQSFQTIVPSLVVSLAATPCLLAIVAAAATQELLARVGSASEEVFRGDRLPVLHFPVGVASPVENRQD
jgi:hypothetical protein